MNKSRFATKLRIINYLIPILFVAFNACTGSTKIPDIIPKPNLSAEEKLTQISKIKENINSKPEWLFPMDACPADVMP
ncbi:MAG: hypothetical protein ABIP06_14170, partial [Pyrinomonadaceae bacterium]